MAEHEHDGDGDGGARDPGLALAKNVLAASTEIILHDRQKKIRGIKKVYIFTVEKEQDTVHFFLSWQTIFKTAAVIQGYSLLK